MSAKIVVIDVETENTGYDIMEDNTRIISIQFNDCVNQELYFVDSKTKNLEAAKIRIKNMINDRFQFIGYNIINFDLIMLKKFLDIEIPRSQVTDIGDMKSMISLKSSLNRKGIPLEDACHHFGVNCEHKSLLRPLVERIKQSPEVIEGAKSGGLSLANKKGWGVDFSRKYALDKISGGIAILESYNDFIRTNASPDSIFYRYAMGDVIEYQLYQKVNIN